MPARRRRLLIGTVAAAALLAPSVAVALATTSSAAVAVTATVEGSQWGVSTCNLGAVEGNTRFDVDELLDMGVNAYRVYGGISRWERSDDDGVYGSPSIAAIKADPNLVNWTAWDTAMTSPPRGSDYSWSTPSNAIWQGNARTLFQALKDNSIRPVVTLRDQDNFGGNTWLTRPPSSQADWNEWWQHAFATVYWFNVRNDYRVDDWEIHNEPDSSAQGWQGTQAQYYDFVQYTADAIRHVYATYLPGRTPRIHAPNSQSNADWPQGALANVRNEFNTVNIHNYNPENSAYNQQTHAWMNANGAGDYPLWLGEWGTYNESYDTLGMSLRSMKNMIKGSYPGNEHVDGSLIFSMYDWISSNQFDTFNGVVSSSGDPSWTYYGFRMASRALQGCRATHRTTTSTPNVTAITTKDASGALYFLAVNGNEEITLDVDLSALGTSGTGTQWRQDASHADEVAGSPALTGGRLVTTIPGDGAVLIKLTNVTPPSAGPSLYDDFEDGDSTGWSSTGGTWSVTQQPGSSKEFTKTDSNDGLSTRGSAAWSNYRVQTYAKLDDDAGSVAVLARVQDANRFYQLELRKDSTGAEKWWIWKRDGDTWTQLASGAYAFSANTYYLLRLEVNGSQLTASASADFGASFESLGSAVDSSYSTGFVGVRATSSSATFDEFRVTGL